MASVIDLMTGYPMDFEVLFNYCKKCNIAEEKQHDHVWRASHIESCQKNFQALLLPWKWNVLNVSGPDPLNSTNLGTKIFLLVGIVKLMTLSGHLNPTAKKRPS